MNLRKVIRRHFEKQVDGVAIPSFPAQASAAAGREKPRGFKWINALGYVLLVLVFLHFLLNGGIFGTFRLVTPLSFIF